MQVESLKMFCDLVDTGSFTKAAQINGVTQSAISQQLVMLEHAFHSRLLARTRKQYRPTPEGEILYQSSRQISRLVSSLNHKLQALQDGIKVATTHSIGLYVLPRLIKESMHSSPAVQIHAEYRSASQVYEDVASGIADLGLVAYPTKHYGLEIIPIRQEPLVLVCPPQHPFAQAKAIALQALDGQKFISFEPENPALRALDKTLGDQGLQVKHVLQFDSVEPVKRAVELDAGISLLPQSTVRQEIERQTLIAITMEDRQFFHPIAAIRKKTRALPSAMQQFLAILQSEV